MNHKKITTLLKMVKLSYKKRDAFYDAHNYIRIKLSDKVELEASLVDQSGKTMEEYLSIWNEDELDSKNL